MAVTATTTIEVQTGGTTSAGGGFDVAATFATDGAATSANTSAPVFSSASYTFVAGDVGAFLFLKLGTNSIPGWYAIASVSAGAATLTAGIGTSVLYGGVTILNTVAGIATTASPTTLTWGVDYSQQSAVAVTFTDMVIGVTTTQFTSVANPIGKNMVGNVLNVTSGTGFTVQRVTINSTSTITATCSTSLGTTGSTGGNGKLGGAISTFSDAASAAATSNKIFVKAGAGYTNTAGVTFSTGQAVVTNSVMPNRLIGYTTTRGDNGRATITLSTNTGITALTFSNGGWIVENIAVNCSSLGTSSGITMSGQGSSVLNCKVSNFTSTGITYSAGGVLANSEITGGSSATQAIFINSSTTFTKVARNYIHDNVCPGILCNSSNNSGVEISHNLITNNTGASSDGISISTNGNATVFGNTIYGSGRDGIRITNRWWGYEIKGNILAKNGGYGLNDSAGAGSPAGRWWDGNGYWSNTSGIRNQVDDTSTNPINGVASYVNTLDVVITGTDPTNDPFTNKSGGDFSINNTAGAGALWRAVGLGNAWSGSSTTGYRDMGAVQHQDSGSSVTMVASVQNINIVPYRVTPY